MSSITPPVDRVSTRLLPSVAIIARRAALRFARTPQLIVLATIQDPQGTLCVAGAKAASGKVTITLTAKAKSSLPVGYFVVN